MIRYVTLRIVPVRGWNAAGLLEPLWGRVGGRDKLAALTRISGSNLSAMNSGKRRMGHEAGERIALALGVTIYELGAPRDAVQGRQATLFDRLAALEVAVDQQGREMTEALRDLAQEVQGLSRKRSGGGPPTKRTAAR